MNVQAETVEDGTDDFQQELEAMKVVGDVLQQLNYKGRERVLQWVISRFLPSGNTNNVIGIVKPAANSGTAFADATENAEFSDLPTLFDAASPKTGVDKALVVGYWIQECQGSTDFVSQQINTELKHLGHGVGNITDAFNALIAQKLVMQIRKSGVTKQARKKYKLTREGVKRVQQMLQGVSE